MRLNVNKTTRIERQTGLLLYNLHVLPTVRRFDFVAEAERTAVLYRNKLKCLQTDLSFFKNNK